MSHPRFALCMALAVLLGSVATSNGATIVLDAVEDTYGRNGANTAVNNGLYLLQSRTGNSSSANRSMLQFDLNQPALIGGTITSAYMQYYQVPTSLNETAPAASSTFTIADSLLLLSTVTVSPFDDSTMTYSDYLANYDSPTFSTNSPLGNLSRNDATPSDFDNTYLVGDTTTDTTAISNLQGRLDNLDPAQRFQVFLILSGSGQTRLFSDREHGNPVQLVIEYTPAPEPSTFVLGGLGAAAIGLVAWRRRRVA